VDEIFEKLGRATRTVTYSNFPFLSFLMAKYSTFFFDLNLEAVSKEISFHSNFTIDRAMAQAVSLRPLTAEARVRSRVGPCGICGGQSGTGTGFSSSTSVFPCQFHSTGAPLHGKTKETDHLSLHLHYKCYTINLKPLLRGPSPQKKYFTIGLIMKEGNFISCEKRNVYVRQVIMPIEGHIAKD
jgi:hypothetical protein